tara:strand:+ start:48 stop:404 length:357 start_codon:yes stop_codon:yes gene_type:complete
MNYKEADLPDNTYKMLRKHFGDYYKDGRPNPPGYRGPNPKDVRPVITGKKMKTFKQFLENLDPLKIGSTAKMYGKQTGAYDSFIRDVGQKSKEMKIFRKMTGFPVDLVKRKKTIVKTA